jgi:hypothetical protein
MPEDEKNEKTVKAAPQKSKMPLIAASLAVLATVIMMVLFLSRGPEIETEKPIIEYLVKEKTYQLKDGSHLLLEFSIVVDEDKLSMVKEILERESPSRLPNSINMLVAGKSREDLIAGTHKREAFARELKKMLEERVFDSYNKRQKSSQNIIEVKEILLSGLVTQRG